MDSLARFIARLFRKPEEDACHFYVSNSLHPVSVGNGASGIYNVESGRTFLREALVAIAHRRLMKVAINENH